MMVLFSFREKLKIITSSFQVCDYHVYIEEKSVYWLQISISFCVFLFQKATVANTMMMKTAFLLTMQTLMDINNVLLLGEGLAGEGM